MTEGGVTSVARAAAPSESCGAVQERVDTLRQSPEDRRRHRALQLTNGMRVLLVSDPETDKAAAALTVQVGSMCDPPDVHGLAHFCEHMLFMGTERYPDESEYSRFITEHGGSSNAFTTADKTSYYFDVGPDHFEPALDRFAQFFLCPLFDVSSTEREISAVHSEHERNVTSDVWRLRRAESVTCRPGHAQCQFSTGNRETLTAVSDLRDRLFAFHRRWYSAALMAVTLVGRESLDLLQQLAVDKFAAVVKHMGVEVPSWPQHALGDQQLRTVLRCVPLKQVRRLKLQFALPDLSAHFASKPAAYVSHLVGHEGAGSVYAELRRRSWATALEAGGMQVARGYGLFYVSVELTDEGETEYISVVRLIFQYIDMLRRDGPQRWIFDECARLRMIAFRFKDVERPIDYVVRLSQWTLDLPMDRILDGKHVIDKFEPGLISEVLELLRPENARLVLFSKSQADHCDQTEQWYGVKYDVENLSEERLAEWSTPLPHASLHLPTKNEFIASDFTLVPERRVPENGDDSGQNDTGIKYSVAMSDNTETLKQCVTDNGGLTDTGIEPPLTDNLHHSEPQLVVNSPLLRVWHHSYRQFQLPKAVLRLNIVSPLVYSDPNLFNIARMFSYLLLDTLNECVYCASLADLQLNFFCTRYGFQLYAAGFSDKLPLLIERAVSAIISFTVDRRRFAVLHTDYLRRLRNHDNEQPAALSGYWLTAALLERTWDSDALLRCGSALTADTLERVWPMFWQWLHVECLVAGNLSADGHCCQWLAPLINDRLASALGSRVIEPQLVSMLREVELPPGRCYVLERPTTVHPTCGVSMYVQCGVADLRSRALLDLLVQLLREPAFDQLRTVEQLGYIVSCSCHRTASAQGLLFTVQSDKSPEYVHSRIGHFLLHMHKQLQAMSDTQFEQHKAALIVRKLERPKSLQVAFLHDWLELSCRQYCFGRSRRECQHLQQVDRHQLLRFFSEHVVPAVDTGPGSGSTRKMAVYVRPTTATTTTTTAPPPPSDNSNEPTVERLSVEDLAAFKQQRALLPHVRPYRDLPVCTQQSGSPCLVTLETSQFSGVGHDLPAAKL